jgi:creatinine amidohydrolase
MFLHDMKWPEIDALDREKVIAVACISALEQHSLHLPVSTDYLIGSEIVRRVERELPSTLLCLPPIWQGCSSHHMDFAGTISISVETMSHMLRDIVESVMKHGFRKLLILNSHGGNRATLSYTIQAIGHKYAGALIVGATYWDLVTKELWQARETEFGGMGHACELETSILLNIAPELVDLSKAEPDGMTLSESEFGRNEMLSSAAVAVYKTFAETSRQGGHGDPRSASAEKGERFLEIITTGVKRLCHDMLAGKV